MPEPLEGKGHNGSLQALRNRACRKTGDPAVQQLPFVFGSKRAAPENFFLSCAFF